VPGVVIEELDRSVIYIKKNIHQLKDIHDSQKNEKREFRHKMWWFSRRASLWILNKMKEKKSVKGQALTETVRPSGSWNLRSELEVGSI
jgi:hypothetical protein